MKLKTKIIYSVVFTTIFTLFGREAWVLYNYKITAEKELLDKIEKTDKMIVGAVSNPIYNLDYELLNETLELFFYDPDIKSIRFVENQGITDTILDKNYISDIDTITKELKVIYRDVELGTIIVVYTKNTISEQIKTSFKEGAITVTIVIFLLVAILASLLYQIVKPINDLIKISVDISKGDLNEDIKIKTNDEFGILTANFIKMRDSIKSQIEQIQSENLQRREAESRLLELNNSLEIKVKDRTIELETAFDDLKSAQKQLIESEKMSSLGMLVAGVAHEINTPIGIGVTAASHLKDEIDRFRKSFNENKITKSYLDNYLTTSEEIAEIILSNMNKGRALIQSFKNIAVDQSSEIKRQFKIREYIDEILLSTRSKFKRTKHKINIYCENELTIESYPGAISQIFTNLLMNSLIHGFDGIDEGIIDIIVTSKKSVAIIKYKDNGLGISKLDIDKIFNPFFTTKRGLGGSGLGLSIVYNLVTTTLEGEIICESEIGLGTTFTISVPGIIQSTS